MTRTLTVMSCLGVVAVASILLAATAQDKKGGEKKPDDKPAIGSGMKEAAVASADTAKYKEAAPGAMMATIWGDPDKGAHRVWTKFAPGATFPLHTHTSEMHIVVIKGAYVYKPEKGDEKRVTAGGYINIPAGDRHASGGDARDGALFYEESSGKFDLLPVEVKK